MSTMPSESKVHAAYQQTKEQVLDAAATADGILAVNDDGDHVVFVADGRYDERERDEIHRALLRSGAHQAGKPSNPIEMLTGGAEVPDPRLDTDDERVDRETAIRFLDTEPFLQVVMIPDADDNLAWDGEGGADYRGGRLSAHAERQPPEDAKRAMVDFCTP